jgi:RimJ/RimL family protein N-acetyltransferase/anti-anti-sigma regulatory factor
MSARHRPARILRLEAHACPPHIGDTTRGWDHRRAPHVTLRVPGALSADSVRGFCRDLQHCLDAGAKTVSLDLRSVARIDVVGLAALLQAVRRVTDRGASIAIAASEAVRGAALRAGLLDELPLDDAALDAHAASPCPPNLLVSPGAAGPSPLARTGRLALRPPAWHELQLFQRWGNEPLLDLMVGSEVLYLSRHLDPHDPAFIAAVLSDPASLTVLIEPVDAPSEPVGFLRLYNIHLPDGFAFLETAVANLHAIKKGWGIEASRLFLAYASDVLGLRRVEAKVYAYNRLSINSLKRNGFKLEGVLRSAHVYEERRWDILVFAILADEMTAQRTREQFPAMGFW